MSRPHITDDSVPPSRAGGGGGARPVAMVIALCAAVALVDGFDTQAISLAAPAIGAEWQVDPHSFGTVFSVGLLGGLVGAMAAGVIGDRVGRRPLVLFGVLEFALLTLLTPALATSMESLEVLRFITGIGLGAAVPGIVSLASEYAPARSRATVVGLMWCGFPMGAVVGGLLAAWMIPALGWQSLFYVGGVAPLLVLVVAFVKLPESARFLQVRGDTAGAAEILDRLGIEPETADAETGHDSAAKSPVVDLFRQGRAAGTLLLWAVMFCTLLMAYFLAVWLPTIAAGAGMSNALLAVSALNLGGVVGCLVISRISDRLARPARLIGAAYAVGAVFIALIGWANGSGGLLLLVTFVAGLGAIGAQLCTVSLSAMFYETRLRATGVGWSAGAGRLGGIVGPMLGAKLLADGASPSTMFLVAGGAALLCGLVLFAFSLTGRPRRRTPEASGPAEAEAATAAEAAAPASAKARHILSNRRTT
ncbi:MFS transporter [Streptomyces sp. NPDC004610]|uniref:MFS transporter n=1 Tax=unclassified Streptomyces TaxID=2593676 RepID=UPI0033BA77CA